MNKPPVKVDYYFSFRSPYAWIAHRLLAQTLGPKQYELLNFIPYWEPQSTTLEQLRARDADFLYQPMTKEKHLYILQDVKRITQRLEFKHVWPIDRNPVWESAILAYLAADRLGQGITFRDLVYVARWEQGLDIHSQEVLDQLADKAGLDHAQFKAMQQSAEVQSQAVDCLAKAWKASVFGIPFFVVGRDKYWGVDRLSAVLKILKSRALEQSNGPTGETAVSPATPDVATLESVLDFDWEANHWDSDAAGGCG